MKTLSCALVAVMLSSFGPGFADAEGMFGTLGGALGGASQGGDAGLIAAVNAGDYGRVSQDLSQGANANATDEDGTSALMLAVGANRADIAGLLVSRGVNVNYQRGDGMTALIMASGLGNAPIVASLLGAGADVDAKNSLGDTPLSIAQQQRHEQIVRMLTRGRREDAQDEGSDAGEAPRRARRDDQAPIDQEKWQEMMDKAVAKAEAKKRAGEDSGDEEIDSPVDHPKFHKPERPDDFAVVVGVEKYAGDLPPAQFAERDAQAVRAHLVALGVPERNIKTLKGVQASKGKLEAYIEDWLPRNVKPDSRVFFYFSGHGAPDPSSSQAYLVPFDGDPNFLDKTAYPVKKLYANLNALKAKRIIVALDSCFSGAGGRSVLAEGARPLVTKVDAGVVAEGGKLVLFAAASPKEITSTLKDQGHGIFTYYLLKGLDGAAKDESGAVTARSLYDYLKPKVQDAASRQNRDQTPVLQGAADGLRIE